MPRSRGFTLIELLVVIAIIAILAAILFPVFAQAKSKGQQTACLNNSKQIATGMRIYVDDFDGTYPGAGCSSEVGWVDGRQRGAKSAILNGEIYPYVKNDGVYKCPVDPYKTSNTYSFSMNVCMRRRIEAAVPWPTTTVLLIEEDEETAGGGTGLNDGCYYPANGNDWPGKRHEKGGHIIYADTHVKWHLAEAYIYDAFGNRGARRIGRYFNHFDVARPTEEKARLPFRNEHCFE